MSDIDFNGEQAAALSDIQSFIEGDGQVFILRGYAGTGKTTLLEQVVRLAEGKMSIQLMAPTGRAANVLGKKTDLPATTIHRGIYNFAEVQVKVDKEDIARTEVKFYYPINLDMQPKLCIVDEGSMVGNKLTESELWSFGSGHLLDDLLTYVNFKCGGKLLIVGDPGQLPPVGEAVSSALSDDFYLAKGIRCQSATLTEVMRQDKDSIILRNAMRVRDAYEQGAFSDFTMQEGEGCQKIHAADVVDRYTEMYPMPGIANSAIICYSNRLSTSYNLRIREIMYGQPNMPLQAGDVLIAAANHYDKTNNPQQAQDIMNGEFCQVLQVCRTEEQTAPVYVGTERRNITVCYAEVDMLLQTGDSWHGWIVTDPVLTAPDGKISVAVLKAMYISFCMRHPDLSKNTESQEFKTAMREDPYLNAIKVRYGYSVTCHKSQGGEWDTVFIDFSDVHLDRFGARWIYTAVTRARKMAYVVNAPDVTPMQKISIAPIVVSKTPLSIYPQPIPRQVVESPFHTAESMPSLIARYGEVLLQLKGSGYEVVDIQHLAYVERYTFQTPEGHYVKADLGYNGKGLFRAPTTPDACLQKLLSLEVEDSLEYPEFVYEPTETATLRLYEWMVDACSATGVRILKVDERLDNWHVLYCLLTSGKFAWMDFSVNAKGFVTYVSPHSDREDDEKLQQLLAELQHQK